MLALTLELEKRVDARTAELRAAQDELQRTNSELLMLTLDLEKRVSDRTLQLTDKHNELNTMTQQLWQAAKLATMGELAASVAHELNNPLAIVSLRIKSLLAQASQRDSEQRELMIVEHEIERMANLVSSLLEFGRRGPQEIATIAVRDEIEQTLELVRNHLRNHSIKVDLRCAADLPAIMADRQQLRQVFLNLFTNASDAMPQGGTLTIQASVSETSPRWVVIEFADVGIGIPPELLAKVMEPFFTTKPIGKGTGLGLPICRRIVQEHHGMFDLSSTVGEGTRVTIKLPAINNESAEPLGEP